MEVIDVREISRSADGKSREVVYIGKGEGRRNRGASRTDGHGKPRRRVSVTKHETLKGTEWN